VDEVVSPLVSFGIAEVGEGSRLAGKIVSLPIFLNSSSKASVWIFKSLISSFYSARRSLSS